MNTMNKVKTLPEITETESGTAISKSLPDNALMASPRASINTDCIAKLYIAFPNGQTWQGSAFLYGTNALATAGHCIYDPRYGGMATSIRVVFPDGTTETVPRSRLHAPQEWLEATVDDMKYLWRYDYGAIKLNSTPGRTLGFLDYLIPSNAKLSQYVSNGTEIHVAGYKAGETWLRDNVGVLSAYTTDDLSFTAEFLGGQSGCPVVLGGTDTFIGIANYLGGTTFDPSAARITYPIADFLDLYY